MGIYHMKRKDLIAKIERDQAAVASAAAVVSDNAALQAEIARLKGALGEARDKPAKIKEVPGPERVVTKVKEVPGPVRTVTKEVTTPCPKQAKEIKALKKRLQKFDGVDLARFDQWRKMVAAAEGNP